MAYCSSCGSFIPEGAKFCENCGTAVTIENNNYNEPVRADSYNQPDYNYQPPQSDPGFNQNNYQQPYQQTFVRPQSSVSFGEAISMFFKRYVDFSGRSVKSEFWYVFLFNFIIGIVLGALSYKNNGLSVIASLYSLATFIPGLALSFRRLHDIGKSGIYILITLVPIAGVIIFIVWMTQDSAGDNEYGPAPEYTAPNNYY
ncbi:MAG: DUF805 domain-containing protein [Clostridia bacterium]|nr:DUF805 domain-containing protein [Clostridia bacterium]